MQQLHWQISERFFSLRIRHILNPSVSDGNLSVYPNPATDRLYVVNAAGNTDITIYSISGSVVLHTVVGEGGSINIGSLQKGMYLIKMNNTVIKFSKL
jgi:hypothetical protein